MVSLAEAAATPGTEIPRTKGQCGVEAWINTLPPSEQEGARTLVADRTKKATVIHELFLDHGLTLRYEATRKHREGSCACR